MKKYILSLFVVIAVSSYAWAQSKCSELSGGYNSNAVAAKSIAKGCHAFVATGDIQHEKASFQLERGVTDHLNLVVGWNTHVREQAYLAAKYNVFHQHEGKGFAVSFYAAGYVGKKPSGTFLALAQFKGQSNAIVANAGSTITEKGPQPDFRTELFHKFGKITTWMGYGNIAKSGFGINIPIKRVHLKIIEYPQTHSTHIKVAVGF